MKIIVTGAGGFLGARIAEALIASDSPLPCSSLVLTDTQAPPKPADQRVTSLALDLAAPHAAETLISSDTDVLFHLAAVVSGQAEADFDLGLRVNFDATRQLLEALRQNAPRARFVFSSTNGVFGGVLPPQVDEGTAATPENSYGTAKAMCELLIEDYSRRGFVDGRVIRLPTVSVRPGVANAAVTSFASGMVREPLNGLPALVPVPKDVALWVSGPAIVVRNILHAVTLPASAFGGRRTVCLPGLKVTVGEMLEALRAVTGEKVAALVHFELDERITKMVSSFPSNINASRALKLGFVADKSFEDNIKAYIKNDLQKKII